MPVSRLSLVAAGAVTLLSAAPASAQFYFRAPDIASPRITGAEPNILGQALPDASPAEIRAAMVWNLRAALNVAALQCQFAPTLQTLSNYNAIIKDHAAELNSSYATLTKYFVRTAKTAKAGQTALDQYGTRVYSSYSAVYSQLMFCQVADQVSREAVFAPRGQFGEIAAESLGELRNSMTRWGEQQFPRLFYQVASAGTPVFDNDKCWRKGLYQPGRCIKR
ncbi:hypothetical protein [Sphingomonas turrisvirgatae]|uniref:Uncharacterized protein n=1 Tax=Sphingomonas turrisvirgatae TaxID=1888892 RepID=A0A1E3LT64_9SPHN|nr:hypothetical protein [Sphingomonas turrisvirgatae]ODP36904.1 hypothetical protein BFL28_04125 [Sphingomonas turrisvirgatae]